MSPGLCSYCVFLFHPKSAPNWHKTQRIFSEKYLYCFLTIKKTKILEGTYIKEENENKRYKPTIQRKLWITSWTTCFLNIVYALSKLFNGTFFSLYQYIWMYIYVNTLIYNLILFYFIFFFLATPKAYGSSWARDQLQPMPRLWQCQILEPTAPQRDSYNLILNSQVVFHYANTPLFVTKFQNLWNYTLL